MRNRNQSSSGANAQRRSRARLDSLSQRFQLFRGSHPRSTRIPDPLRKAVVSALQNGASRSSVQKACGVSWEQMERWETRYGKKARRPRQRRSGVATTRLTDFSQVSPQRRRPVPPPRVLSVVDEPAGHAGSPHEVAPLELRVSGWRISLHPTDG